MKLDDHEEIMRVMPKAAVLAATLAMASAGAAPAWALGGGGTAPGGPLSGSIRPACNGYDMDGTPTRGGCDGRSVDERAATAPRPIHSR